MITPNLMLQMAIGERLLIVQPDTLSTDWKWEIRERDNPAVVKDVAVSFIPNATRHVFVKVDSRYETDTVYELRIFNDVMTVVMTGVFQCYRAVIGPLSAIDFAGLNAQLLLIAGLQGLNSRWKFTRFDGPTGFPLDGELTIFGDAAFTKIFAIYKLKRRLNKVRQVVGEVMWQTFYDPTAILADTTGTTGTTGGTP